MATGTEQLNNFESKDIFDNAMKKLDAGFWALVYDIENKYPNVEDLPQNILNAITAIADRLNISPEKIAAMTTQETQELINFVNERAIEAWLDFPFALGSSLSQAYIDYQNAANEWSLWSDKELYGLQGSLDQKEANV